MNETRAPDSYDAPVKLAGILSADDIVIGVRGADISDVAARLLRQTLPHHGLVPNDIERMIHSVVARERELATLCGNCALPHARDASIGTFIAALGANRDGVIEGRKQPRIVIAFLSPESQRAEHLVFLAALSRLAADTATMDAIANAAAPEEVLEILRRATGTS